MLYIGFWLTVDLGLEFDQSLCGCFHLGQNIDIISYI